MLKTKRIFCTTEFLVELNQRDDDDIASGTPLDIQVVVWEFEGNIATGKLLVDRCEGINLSSTKRRTEITSNIL